MLGVWCWGRWRWTMMVTMISLLPTTHYTVCNYVEINFEFNFYYFLLLACESGKWGENCASMCNCLPSACNSVHGCTSCRNAGLTGANCDKDLDECLSTPPVCGSTGICNNTVSSYFCSCPDWYKWNGSDCYRELICWSDWPSCI